MASIKGADGLMGWVVAGVGFGLGYMIIKGTAALIQKYTGGIIPSEYSLS